jgi:hypothetical protein
MKPIDTIRTTLRRNKAIHSRWESIKKQPIMQQQLRRRALATPPRSASAIEADRNTANGVIGSVHNVLQGSALDGHWHLWAGALIGWARHGALLDFDLNDIDLAIDEAHLATLVALLPEFERAGLSVMQTYVSNDGAVREVALERDGVRVDLFVFRSIAGFWDYRVFGDLHGRPSEFVCRVARQPLEMITLAGLQWPKSADHDTELTSIYGDWRTPNPAWSYRDDHSIIRVEDWSLHRLSNAAALLALHAQVG